MHDLSSLQVTDILRKDFKKWTGQGIDLSVIFFIIMNLMCDFTNNIMHTLLGVLGLCKGPTLPKCN